VVQEAPGEEEMVEAPDVTAPSERPQVPETVDVDRLQAARQALDSGDLEAAETAYRQTLEAGDNLSFLISELEAAAEDHPPLLQLLGDSYMQNGQLQKALDAYREALKSL
jgi:tetratricopeptide (TPR) repeat protein